MYVQSVSMVETLQAFFLRSRRWTLRIPLPRIPKIRRPERNGELGGFFRSDAGSGRRKPERPVRPVGVVAERRSKAEDRGGFHAE